MKQIIMVAKAALRTYSGCGPKLCGPKCQSAPCTMLQEEGFIYANKLTPEGGGGGGMLVGNFESNP